MSSMYTTEGPRNATARQEPGAAYGSEEWTPAERLEYGRYLQAVRPARPLPCEQSIRSEQALAPRLSRSEEREAAGEPYVTDSPALLRESLLTMWGEAADEQLGRELRRLLLTRG